MRTAIRSATAGRRPPGPPSHSLLGNARDLQGRALDFFLEIARDYGDIATIRLLGRTCYVVSHPDGIRHVLQRNHTNYDRGIKAQRPLRHFLGNGLPLADGDVWRQQRRLMQPAFHRERVAALAGRMVTTAAEVLDGWPTHGGRGEAGSRAETVDVQQEMLHLGLRIAGETLFGLDLTDRHNRTGTTFESMVRELAEYVFLPFPPLSVPTPRNRRIRATLRTLDAVVTDVIERRRRPGVDRADLLAMLVGARGEDGRPITDRQLRDDIVSVLFAGYETTANTLAWACYELARNPDVQRNVGEEVDTVLRGGPPVIEDLGRLPGIRAVIDEVLRVYPPTFALPRRAVAGDTICGYDVPAGALVWANICAVHRDPAFWARPEVFDPDRFAAGGSDPGVRRAYFPFGAGPHLCIGNTFALAEAHLVLAMIVQRWWLKPLSPQPIQPVVELTVRPRGGLPLLVLPRG